MQDLTTDELLTTTRSVRRRPDLERPVPRGVVEECLALALQAPNGSNQQPWRWIAIDEPAVRAAIAAEYVGAIDDYAREVAGAGSTGEPVGIDPAGGVELHARAAQPRARQRVDDGPPAPRAPRRGEFDDEVRISRIWEHWDTLAATRVLFRRES